MGDRDLRDLERDHAATPDDLGITLALERARLRRGLGWAGERLPAGLSVKSEERGVYLLPMPVSHPDDAARGWVEMVRVPAGASVPAFYVGRYPVTWGQHGAFRRATEAPFQGLPEWARLEQDRARTALAVGEGDGRITGLRDHPVILVSRDDALAFCAWAGLRLPTAEEWRWAALGPRTPRYPWGDDPPSPERCVWPGGFAGSPTRHVGATAPVVEVRCKLWPACNGKHDWDDGNHRRSLVPARPAGASWCGMQDAVGNVWEIVESSEPGVTRLVGGSFRTESIAYLRTHPGLGVPERSASFTADDVGFRVALSGAP